MFQHSVFSKLLGAITANQNNRISLIIQFFDVFKNISSKIYWTELFTETIEIYKVCHERSFRTPVYIHIALRNNFLFIENPLEVHFCSSSRLWLLSVQIIAYLIVVSILFVALQEKISGIS